MQNACALLTSLLLSGCLIRGADTNEWTSAHAADELGGAQNTAAQIGPFSAPDLVIADAQRLRAIEAAGWSAARVLQGAGTNLQQLYASSPLYRQLVTTLRADLDELTESRRATVIDYTNGPPEPGNAGEVSRYNTYFGGVAFNPEWFLAHSARLELIAVVNRLDLADTEHGTCGETRFLYRLAYTGTHGASRLPAIFSAIYDNPSNRTLCYKLARAWASMTEQSDWRPVLRALQQVSPTRIETNLQNFHTATGSFPAVGGRFEYLLRAFHVAENAATPILLRNTPRSNLNENEIERLRAYLTEHRHEVDTGRLELPDEFLASRALSAQPYGFSLRSNRPFAHYFPDSDTHFTTTELSDTQNVRNQSAFVRRLDEMSCNGCHATRGIAGFHFVGREMNDDSNGTAMEIAASNHFVESVGYRRAKLAALANAETRVIAEPFPEHALDVPGTAGAHCGLPHGGFDAWTCATGFVCMKVAEERVGRCLPEVPQYGTPCRSSEPLQIDQRNSDVVIPNDWTEIGPDGYELYYDDFGNGEIESFCNDNGWPDGQFQGYGYLMSSGVEVPAPGVVLPAMNASISYCFLRGARSFNDCVRTAPDPANEEEPEMNILARCDATLRCHDGYACGRFFDAEANRVGICLPPYFIASMQLLGHDVR